MDGNANPFGHFSEHCILLSEVQEVANELTCADFATWRPLQALHCQVYEPKVDVLVDYLPLLILLDAILIPTIAKYCSWEHHNFETACGNHAV